MILGASSRLLAQRLPEEFPVLIKVGDTMISKQLGSSSGMHDGTDYYIDVVRNNKGDSVKLLLPAGSTGNAVDLYLAQDYYQYNYENLTGHAIRSDCVFMKGFGAKLNLDLTSLIDGDYIAIWNSCYVGGIIKVSLVTE